MPVRRQTIWTRKPLQSLRVNWSNPLSNGLIFALPFVEGSGPTRDVVSGIDCQSEGTPTWISTPDNVGMSYVNSITKTPNYRAELLSKNITITVRWSPNALVTTGSCIADCWVDYTGSGYPWLLQSTSDGTMSMRAYDGSNAPIAISRSLTAGSWYTISGTRTRGGSLSLYTNGTLDTTVSDTATTAITNANPISFSGRINTTSRCISSTISLVLIHDHEMTSQGIALLHANPWQIFQPAPGRWMFGSGGAAFSAKSRRTISSRVGSRGII